MPPVTNQQIFAELQNVNLSIKNLETNQEKQGKQILDILLKNAKEDGKKEGEAIVKVRRKNEKIMLWTVIASLATAIGCVIAVASFISSMIPKVG